MKKKFILLLGICMLFINDFSFGQMPGQVPLKPSAIPQFVDALPHFAGLRVDASGGNMVIRYDSTQQIAVSTGTKLATGTVGALAPSVGLARFWGYSVSNNGGNSFTPSHWPSFTIEAHRGTPLNVRYENNLFGATYSRVNMMADQTLHWADPLMAMNSMLMTPYTGPIPVSPHLHGGEVASESDGGPDSWFTPGYAITGPSWNSGVDQNYLYPNTQEAATIWYHDHSLGVTRLNVYAGLAGFYFLRGPDEEAAKLPGWTGDDLVQEVTPVGKTNPFAVNPYLPEIEVAFQDRMFDNTGSLYFPNLPTNPMVHPFWTPEFLGDVITVNGKTWPYLSVAPRKYRFRLLNGSNARFYELQLKSGNSVKNTVPILQVGTDGGLLDTPVSINALGGILLMAPGERADVVIDFSAFAGKTLQLTNSAKTPYPNGAPPNGSTVGQIMQFIVNGKMVSAANTALAGTDKSLVPTNLRSTPLVKLTNFAGAVTPGLTISKTRQLTLNEVMGMGGPLEVLVNNSKWGLVETELPIEGTTELWKIINTTADAHPIHLHLVQFQLVGRQAFDLKKYSAVYNAAFTGGVYKPSVGPPLRYDTPNADGAIGGNPAVTPFLLKTLFPPKLNEQGWKDTYIVYPGEVTTFVIRFAPTDKPINSLPADLVFGFDPSMGPGYVWHCHIIDHEDNEMMRPYMVLPNPARAALKSAPATAVSKANTEKEGFILEQNSPNPFTTETEIRYSIPEESHVQLKLYSIMGVELRTLVDANQPAGIYNLKISSENLANGTYFYRLKAGENIATKKMVILK